MTDTLETKLAQTQSPPTPHKKKKWTKEFAVDTLGGVSYSLIVGAGLDYWAGLRGVGILASRASATAINLPASGPYGAWRDYCFRVTHTKQYHNWQPKKEAVKKVLDGVHYTRKTLVDLFAFNTFQVPIFGTALAIGSYISNCELEPNQARLIMSGAYDMYSHLASFVELAKEYITSGHVEWEKPLSGMKKLASISWAIGPTMGWYMNGVRRLFKVKTPSQKVSQTINS